MGCLGCVGGVGYTTLCYGLVYLELSHYRNPY